MSNVIDRDHGFDGTGNRGAGEVVSLRHISELTRPDYNA